MSYLPALHILHDLCFPCISSFPATECITIAFCQQKWDKMETSPRLFALQFSVTGSNMSGSYS
jgi:hypothetical protein